MSTLFDGLTNRTKIWRGAGRVLVAPSGTTFPTALEDIINPLTYVLGAGWQDVGPTSEDGIKVRREIETFDGIAVDQLKTKLDEGEPENTTMSVEMTLMHNDLNTLAVAWEGGTVTAIPGGVGTVAQHSMALDAPVAFTERLLAVVQRDEVTGLHRAFAFRKAIPQVEDEVGISGGEASELPLKFACKPDTTIGAGDGIFGEVFSETLPMDIPVEEGRLLVALYRATDGENWTADTGWLTEVNAADWLGVTVSGGRVTQIDLSGNDLDGSIASFDFRRMGQLTAFDLSDNASLTGDIATILWPSRLQTLDLSGTGMTHGSGTSGLSSIYGLRSLVVADMGWNATVVDYAIGAIYAGRAGYTFTSPTLDVGGTNAAPSGTYQEACPPTTALEQVHQLENDGCEEGINLWLVTRTV